MRIVKVMESAAAPCRTRRIAPIRVLLAGMLATTVVAGCRSDSVFGQLETDPALVFWRLAVNHPTVVLSVHAPYDTVQLHASAVNAFGNQIPADVPASFRKLVSTDASFDISEDGLLTARSVRSASKIIEVRLTVGDVTHSDTVTVMIRNDSPVRLIDSIRLAPGTRDSTHRWAGTLSGFLFSPWRQWVRVYESTGGIATVSQYPVRFFWDDGCIVGLCSVSSAYEVGETYMRAELFAYGQSRADSVLIRNIDPPLRIISIRRVTTAHGGKTIAFYPSELTIQTGTTVVWGNGKWNLQSAIPLNTDCGLGEGEEFKNGDVRSYLCVQDSVDIVFDDTGGIGVGDTFGPVRWLTQSSAFEENVGSMVGYPSDGGSGNISSYGQWICEVMDAPSAPVDCGAITAGQFDLGLRSRKFLRPGTYRFTSMRYPGVSGVIHVKS